MVQYFKYWYTYFFITEKILEQKLFVFPVCMKMQVK